MFLYAHFSHHPVVRFQQKPRICTTFIKNLRNRANYRENLHHNLYFNGSNRRRNSVEIFVQSEGLLLWSLHQFHVFGHIDDFEIRFLARQHLEKIVQVLAARRSEIIESGTTRTLDLEKFLFAVFSETNCFWGCWHLPDVCVVYLNANVWDDSTFF